MDEFRSVVIPGRQPEDDLILQYDDTFDGLMTAIFESYNHKPAPTAIVGLQHQQILSAFYKQVETDEVKSRRVTDGILREMGAPCGERVWTAFMSTHSDKGSIIYRFVRLGMKVGRTIVHHLTNDIVLAMNDIVGKVEKEALYQRQFTRFSRIATPTASGNIGVYYARISPDNDIISLVMPFFADRFHVQPFIIHDTNRELAGVYDTKEWYITDAGNMKLPEEGEAGDESAYSDLWKRFYDSVAIKERINHKLRRQHMPKAFWKNITEMNRLDSAPTIALPSDISRVAVERSLLAEGNGGSLEKSALL